MLRRILKHLTGAGDAAQDRLTEQFELVADVGGTLTVNPRRGRLGITELHDLAERLLESGGAVFRWICFDFSHVDELVGPWGGHFAVLIRLDRGLGGKVSMSGLHHQPAAVAWLFRHSPEIGALLSVPALRGPMP